MEKTMKRIEAIILTLAMLITLIPMSAVPVFAETDPEPGSEHPTIAYRPVETFPDTWHITMPTITGNEEDGYKILLPSESSPVRVGMSKEMLI